VTRDVLEAFALALFRQARINHVELSQMLGLDRLETDVFLQRHGVTEGTLTMDDLELQTEISRRVSARTRTLDHPSSA
jgi:hypothetical protein